MKNLNELKKVIETILINDENARKDDNYLILRVIEVLHPSEADKSFSEVMLNAKKNRINFESIRRCRQRLQALYPCLKDKETAKAREHAVDSYRNFALGR